MANGGALGRNAMTSAARNRTLGTAIPPCTPASILPTSFVGLDPGAARLIQQCRRPTALPRGCPRVELTTNGDRSSDRDLIAVKSQRGERIIFWSASHSACRRLALVKGSTASTPYTCLVQPCLLQPEREKNGVAKRQWSIGSDCNDKKEEKNLRRGRNGY